MRERSSRCGWTRRNCPTAAWPPGKWWSTPAGWLFQEVVAELPAGKLERGEDHRLAALRELEEEVGASCGRLTYLGCLYSSPGFSSEVLHMYLAQELTEGACHPDEDEFLSVERIPFSALVEQVRQGEIKDAKTVALVLKAKLLGL